MIYRSPLEQFEIYYIFGPITNSALFILLAFILIYHFLYFGTKKGTIIPNRWQSVVELLYLALLNLIKENIGAKGIKYFPFIFIIFIFILFTNLLGMIPYSFTVTSHIVVTFTLSLSIFIGVTLIGLKIHGLHFFSFFVPQGAPKLLLPLLVVIEAISYTARAFSLAIRLFANMMSGHTLLKIIASFGWTLITMGGIALPLLSVIPIALILAITGLEIGIAFLQAYVFTILTCIYLMIQSIYTELHHCSVLLRLKRRSILFTDSLRSAPHYDLEMRRSLK